MATNWKKIPLSGDIANADINASAAIAYSKLGTIPTFNQDTTGTATNATTASKATGVILTDNESTNENNAIPFGAGAAYSGTVGLETDGDFHYNPSTGKVTATTFTGSLTGAVTGQASTVATITGLAPDTATTQGTQGAITSILNTSLVTGRDADNQIQFSTDDQIGFNVAGGVGVTFKATGEIEATSLDISGDADIDGTLETDNLTIGSAQGSDGQVLTSTGSGVGWEDASGGSAIDNLIEDTSPQFYGGIIIDTNSSQLSFDDAHGILDENGNEQVIFKTTTSAVNYMQVANAATGGVVTISAVGSDTNVGLKLATQGAAGVIDLNGKWAIGGTTITTTAAQFNMLAGISLDSDDLNYAKTLFDTGVTGTEFDYLDGVTSAIQTQFSNHLDGTTAFTSIDINGGSITGITDLAVADGGTGVGTSTGSGNVVLSAAPTFTGIIVAAELDISGDVDIAGDLTVSGTTITTATETINIADNTLVLNSDNASTSVDAGFVVQLGSGSGNNPSLWFDVTASSADTTGRWVVGSTDDATSAIGGYVADVMQVRIDNAAILTTSTEVPVGHMQYHAGDLYVRVEDS